jgi:hypothetical protein
MTSLRKRMIEDMQVRNLSVNTQDSYIQQVSRFARHFHKSPELLGAEQIRAYQVYLTNEKKLSTGSILIAIAALRFLYKVKDRAQSKSDIPGGQSHGHGDRDRSLRCRIRQIDLGEYRLGIAQSRHKTQYERWLADRIAAVSVLYIEDETTHHYAAGLELTIGLRSGEVYERLFLLLRPPSPLITGQKVVESPRFVVTGRTKDATSHGDCIPTHAADNAIASTACRSG